MSDSLDRLLDLLDLEQIEVNIFRGRSPDETVQRVFGGQVAGQALVAAGRTVPADRPVHSLHAYFIRPGDPTVPLVYTVERVRDGRSFTTRRVSAVQHGRTIFTLSASFHRAEAGLVHAMPMPDVPPPEDLEPNVTRLERALGVSLPAHFRDSPIDLRSVGALSVEAQRDPSLRTAHNLVWLRVNGELPDDPLLHVCLMTYASDLTLLDTVLLELGVSWYDGQTSGASLDHAMWFHRPFRADQWLLYAQVSPIAYGARGLAMGEVFTAQGDLVVSVVQEGLIRATPKPPRTDQPPVLLIAVHGGSYVAQITHVAQITTGPERIHGSAENCTSKICCPSMRGYVGFRHVRGPQCRPFRKEVPVVTIKTPSVSVARCGAALRHVVMPWASPSGTGVLSALPQNSGPVLARTPIGLVESRVAAVMTPPFATAPAGLPTDIRKQYVHKTRVNVGGDGASGPHPEREPA